MRQKLRYFIIKYAAIALAIIIICWALSAAYKSIYQYQLSNAVVKNIVIDGIINSKMKKIIINNTKHYITTPMVDIDTNVIKNSLIRYSFVKDIAVYKKPPYTLKIQVKEYQANFIWFDKDNKGFVVNSEGKKLRRVNKYIDSNLIKIKYGVEALYNSPQVRFLIYMDKSLFSKIDTLMYKGYRWDLILKNGNVINLPEDSRLMEKAMKFLITQNNKKHLLSKPNLILDTRIENKIYVINKENKENSKPDYK